MKRKVTAFILALLFLMNAGCALAAGDAETYQAGIEGLERYLRMDENADLDACVKQLKSVQKYQCGGMLLEYGSVLLELKKDDPSFSGIEKSLAALKADQAFADFVGARKDSPIKGANVLESYVNGRIAEKAGDTAAALKCYAACADFFDTALRTEKAAEDVFVRILEWMEKEKYKDAWAMLAVLPDTYPGKAYISRLCYELLPEWSEWSEWDLTEVTATADIQVETITEDRTVRVYKYSRFYYPQTATYNAEDGTYTMSDWTMSNKAVKTYVEGKGEVTLGKWEQTETIGSRVKKNENGRYTLEGKEWYPNGSDDEVRNVTLYRYRTREKK